MSVAINPPDIELSILISLLSREPVPLHRFLVVLRNALSVRVHQPETELSIRTPLLSREPIPLHRFLVVLRNAYSKIVRHPKLVLRAHRSIFIFTHKTT